LSSIALTPSQTAPTKPVTMICDYGLESIALCLLDAFAPTPQVLEISANFSPVLFIYPERDQDGGDGTQNHGVDIAVMQTLLLGQRLGNDRANVFVAHLP
jgi:hypothetical protein